MIRNIVICVLLSLLSFHAGRSYEYKSYRHQLSVYDQVKQIESILESYPVAAMQ